ncbi:MAG: hypothetical protein IJV98_02965 [Clostridia bacterium]|nr:hypothetical protein [Clostridia bacterium]
MQTYVINTSENKNFDGNLLFALSHYEQITWKSCSLNEIQKCAEQICDAEDTRIPFRDFRVVVLVDLFNFSIQRPPLDVAVDTGTVAASDGADGNHASAEEPRLSTGTNGDYVEIYKFFIEHYLLRNLFSFLKENHAPAKSCEIYYIQYTPHTPVSRNEKGMEQTALLFELWDEAKKAAALRHSRQEVSRDETSEFTDVPDAQDGDDKTYTKFTLHCTSAVSLDFEPLDTNPTGTPSGVTFRSFYQSYRIYHRNDVRKFPVVIHEPYVTHGDNPVRAAYDTLVLSLYLIHSYERQGEESEALPQFRMPSQSGLENTLVKAYQKVHSARTESQKTDLEFYYALTPADHVDKTGAAVSEDDIEWRSHDTLPHTLQGDELFCTQYKKICDCANGQAEIDTEKDIQKILEDYQNTRDNTRDSQIEFPKATKTICPSELEKNEHIEEMKRRLEEHLHAALCTAYQKPDYSDLKEKADRINETYQHHRSRSRRFFVDAIVLALTLFVLLMTYIGMQGAATAGFIKDVLLCGIAFLLIYAVSVVCRWIPIIRAGGQCRKEMAEIYEQMLQRRAKSIKEIRACYANNLPAIEKLRYDIRRIERLYKKNQEKYSHIEMHRALLERVEDALVGILNCFHFSTSNIKTIDPRDFFDITKTPSDQTNSVYRILSIDAIDEIFKA